MKFEGSLHSGIDDATNIARIAIKMLNDGCVLDLNEQIQVKHNPQDSKVEVRYTHYKEPRISRDQVSGSNSDNEAETELETDPQISESWTKGGNSSTFKGSNSFSSVGDELSCRLQQLAVEEDDSVDDLLTYYSLQKT